MAKSKTSFHSVADDFRPNIEFVPIGKLRGHPRNARTHSSAQIEQIANSFRQFGMINPVVMDARGTIIAGHARWAAAQRLGLKEIPCVRVEHLSEAQRRAFMIADNKIASNAGWDEVVLADELKDLIVLDPNLDLRLTGFSAPELDELLEHNMPPDPEPEDERLPKKVLARVRPGDIWQLGPHRLICGDAREPRVLAALMGNERAQMVFTDPPYNVPIARNVSGRGQVRHDDFQMGCGEMTKAEFASFLRCCFDNLIRFSIDGSIHFVCMDWRHLGEMLNAGAAYAECKNLIVWVKDSAGKGSFYRSRHEMVFVFKNGTAPHINNFGLGQDGRNRTNVWNYRGMTSRSKEREEGLELHPTIKPVAMIADAMKDVSSPGGIVLDIFGGSGATLIAAQKTGRYARIVEIDPIYCDRMLCRWEAHAKDDAVQIACGFPGGRA